MAASKWSINDSLENLSRRDFEKFRQALVDRPGDRRVPLCKVEDQNQLEVTNVLVSTFTEDGAPAVTSELLRQIGCNNEAEKLDAKMRKPSPPPKLHQGGGAAAALVATRSDVCRKDFHEEEEEEESDDDDDDDDDDDEFVDVLFDICERKMKKLCSQAIEYGRRQLLD